MANEIQVEVGIKTEAVNPFSDTQDFNKGAMAHNHCRSIITAIKIEEVLVKSEVVDPYSEVLNVKQELEDAEEVCLKQKATDPEDYVPCSIKVENLPELPLCEDNEGSREGSDDSQRDVGHDSPRGAKARRSCRQTDTNSKERDKDGKAKGRKRRKRDGARLTGRERAKRYRERLKSDPEKFAERLRKKRETYHRTKKLVSSMKPQEKEEARNIWKCRKKEQRQRKETVLNYANWFTSQSSGIEPFIW